MANFTGYLLGKVQLDGAIRSEVLASLVETLLQRYTPSDLSKKHLKFNDTIKYSVECSTRGLKLSSPGFKSKDEGFESDSESVRSIRMSESTELELLDLMDHLAISKEEKGPPVLSRDNRSLSSSNLHVSDDSNSSSGNGSDSDEFCANSPGERSPYWEPLPNLSSFQSYPIQDVVFCHSDALHPSTLVWVVRHMAKMMALVTTFRTRAEAEELFQRYRDLRLAVKPVKQRMNPMLGTKVPIPLPPVPSSPAPPPPEIPTLAFPSLPSVCPTEILLETSSRSQLFSREPKSLDFDFVFQGAKEEAKEAPSSFSGGTLPRFYSPFPYASPKGLSREEPERPDGEDSDENSEDEDQGQSIRVPSRPQRKVQLGFGRARKGAHGKQPLLLVPLKTENVSSPKSSYPKEAYLYHVMGRSSSTFAPYQRSLNFIPPYAMPNSASANGTEYLSWASSNGRHLLVPFSSWQEQGGARPVVQLGPKSSPSRRSKTSSLNHLSGKGTAKILLRDSGGGQNGVWATLSQRFKRNVRDTLMPKLNGIWAQPEATGKLKKKPNKKVTFNAWATVQMV